MDHVELLRFRARCPLMAQAYDPIRGNSINGWRRMWNISRLLFGSLLFAPPSFSLRANGGRALCLACASRIDQFRPMVMSAVEQDF